MRIASVWREWESGDSLPLSILRLAVLSCGLLFLGFTAVLGLPWPEQALMATLTVVVAIWMDRGSGSYVVTLTLMLLSVYSTFRYGFWRVVTTMVAVRGADTRWAVIDGFFMLLLLGAELYAIVVLLLGYMQMVWPLRRTPVPLPDSTTEWPAVDVLIPTYNEPLDVVRFTVLAALNMDWPAEKLNVYLLDDGRRADFREFARQAGAGYLTRADNRFAKAGNLNAALELVDSPFVVVFDADHVPTRSFLQVTMGWFLRDAQLGILQTPHHFYSPDPFERNLGQFGSIPNEDELFYGVVQDGNDFWNATYFCGSCAVLRRSALDQAGGLATETVTEDAHTSMRMQRLGWNSAYINIPQAAGLATERLSAHVRQRIRWARGMVQILRIENPMFGPGLTFAQRLCYLNAMSHFLYALPRLIFLTAPLMYLVFGYVNIPGHWAAILAYAAPHLVLSRVTRSRMQGRHRHPFWTEIFETVLAPHLVLPTLGALFRPRRDRFSVTPTGQAGAKNHFDSHMARPTLMLLACNWFGLCCSAPRLLQFPSWQVPVWASFVNWPATLYDPGHAGTVAINGVWTVFNLVLLGVSLGVAWESQQRRRSVRVETQVPAEVVLQDSSIVRGVTADLSSGGVRVTMEYDISAAPGDRVEFVFPVLDATTVLPATIVSLHGRTLRARFDMLTLEQYEALTLILYARADRWLGWGDTQTPDRPLASLLRIVRLAMRGLKQSFFGQGWKGEDDGPPRSWTTGVVPVVALLLLLGSNAKIAFGAQGKAPVDALVALAQTMPAATPESSPQARGYQTSFTLEQAGAAGPIMLRGALSRGSIGFVLARGVMVKTAVLRLRYRFSPRLLPGASSLKVTLNGTPVATIPVIAAAKQDDSADEEATTKRGADARLEDLLPGAKALVLESSIALPPQLLRRVNQLAFEFAGNNATACERPTDPALWGRVDSDSRIEVSGSAVALEDDLALLPAPFFTPGLPGMQTVMIAFLSQPSFEALRAAGILASWLGTKTGAKERPIQFAVSVGKIPAGNVIVLSEGRIGLPVALNLRASVRQLIAMQTNPADPAGKVLVVAAGDGAELVQAAVNLARRTGLRGAQMDLSNDDEPTPRASTRWANNESKRMFSDAETADMDGDGSQLARVSVRLAPDFYVGESGVSGAEQNTVPLHLRYRYNGAAAGQGSALEVWANGSFVRSIPLAHTERTETTDGAVVGIPALLLSSATNTLSFRFAFEPVRSGGCAVAGSGGFRGSISKDSFLDLSGLPHWTELPNVGLFARAGFPMTREADLRDTLVILPVEPRPQEIGLFLMFLSRFGAETGTPSTGLTVGAPDALDSGSGKDLLVLGTEADQPILHQISEDLPLGLGETVSSAHAGGGLFSSVRGWWKVAGRDNDGVPTTGGEAPPDAVVEEIEWPHRSKHVMVVVALHNEEAVPEFMAVLERSGVASSIANDVAVLRGGSFKQYRLSSDGFSIGHMPLLARLERAIAQFSLVVAAVSVMFCFLLASLLRTALRRSARVRLQGNY